MMPSGNMTLLSWEDTGARGQTSRAGGEPDQQRTEKEQRQPRQKGSTDTQTGVRDPTDMEEQQRQDRRPRAATSQGSLTGRADQTGSAAPAGLAGRLHQQQPQRNPAQRREQQNTHQLSLVTLSSESEISMALVSSALSLSDEVVLRLRRDGERGNFGPGQSRATDRIAQRSRRFFKVPPTLP